MHSEFVSEFIVQSNHDTSTLEITFSSTQNLYCSYHRIKNCPILEIGVQCIQNLHVNSQYVQSNHDHFTLEITFCSAQNLFVHSRFRGPLLLNTKQEKHISTNLHENINFEVQLAQKVTISKQNYEKNFKHVVKCQITQGQGKHFKYGCANSTLYNANSFQP